MKVEKSIQIETSPKEIWPFLVEPEKVMLWFNTLKKCEFAGKQHSGTGTTYYVEEKVPGPLRKIQFRADAWDEHELLVLRMLSGVNVNSYQIRFQLEPASAGATFHFFEEVGMPFGPVGKILGRLGQRTAARMVEAMLLKLKSLSESRGREQN